MSDAGRKILDGLKDAVAGNFSRVHIPDDTEKLQTWYRRDADGGALLTGNADDHCPGCGVRLGDLPDDPVAIPRPQYEALMGAKDLLSRIKMKGGGCPCDSCKSLDEIPQALAALRSAGIDLEEKT